MTIKFSPNRPGRAAFLKSAVVQQMLEAAGQTIEERAGDGFDLQVNVGADRARATVMAVTPDGRRRQAEGHVLERAVGQGL